MKTHLALVPLIALALPIHAATSTGSPKPGTATQASPAPKPAAGKPAQQATTATTASGATKPSAGEAPASAPAPKPVPASTAGSVTLAAYIKALTDAASLSKDKQADIKAYYQDDGAKLNDILNSATLTPFEQMEQVDNLRAARNAKIESLLRDVDRQDAFLKTEAMYRVALTELAETGGLAPAPAPAAVPPPTATPPAEKVPNS